MNNVFYLPTAKTYLHNYPRKPGPEVIELVYEEGLSRLTKEQIRLLEKKIRLADQILKALPENKKKLFERYENLQLEDSAINIERAIKWVVNHEAEIKEVMAG